MHKGPTLVELGCIIGAAVLAVLLIYGFFWITVSAIGWAENLV